LHKQPCEREIHTSKRKSKHNSWTKLKQNKRISRQNAKAWDSAEKVAVGAVMSARRNSENARTDERIPHSPSGGALAEKRRNNQSARELYTAHNYYSTTTCLFVYANERGGKGRRKDLWSAS
jgi:hypothetical protein